MREVDALWVDLDRYGPASTIYDAVKTEYRVRRFWNIERTDEDLQEAARLLGVAVF